MAGRPGSLDGRGGFEENQNCRALTDLGNGRSRGGNRNWEKQRGSPDRTSRWSRGGSQRGGGATSGVPAGGTVVGMGGLGWQNRDGGGSRKTRSRGAGGEIRGVGPWTVEPKTTIMKEEGTGTDAWRSKEGAEGVGGIRGGS